MKNPNLRQFFTNTAAHTQFAVIARRGVTLALLSGLAIAGTANASLTTPSMGGGPGGTLTNVSGTASVTSQYGNQSQAIAGQTAANAAVTAGGTVNIPMKYSDQTSSAPWTLQFQSGSTADGQVSLAMNSSNTSYIPSPNQGQGSFVEQANWHATLVNTTGTTALFSVILYSNANDAVYFANGALGNAATPGFSAIATASFGNQQYNVSNFSSTFAIDGVMLKPGESANVGLDYKISSTTPFALQNLAFGGQFLGSMSAPVAPVPEPATNAMMALGAVAVAFAAKRRRA